MAEFTAGDRVVKMSGIAAGKYGTVNSVREDGTLNVTFDGERMARFCDPERCGKVAANAKYKTGDFVRELVSDRTWRVGRIGNDTVELWQWPGSGMTVTTIREVEDSNRFIPAPQVAESWKKANANSRAANATFKVGDRAWYKAPSTGEKIEITITGVSGNDYEYVTSDGIKGRTVGYSGKGLYPLNARAANAKFKVGDRVKSAKYPELGEMKVERVFQDIHGTAYRTSRDGFLTDDIHYDRTLIPANSRACNRASVFEYGVGDTVKLRSGRTGEVLAKYVDKNGDIKIDVDLNGTRFTASPEMIDSVVKNSRACNAEITPELRKAYDEWQKAKAKFDKWWNPNRRLSENPPKGADATRKKLDFAAVFKKVTGKLTPNGYGSMTLEQMVDAVSKNAVARNGLSPYGAVSGLLALKWYDKKEDKDGGVMIVRAPFEAVKRYLEQSARNYPYKIAPYGRGWAKVTAPFEW